MRFVIMGPQGCGKGTQGELLAEALDVPPLGMGDILREAAERPGRLGREIAAYQKRGELVPEKYVLEALVLAVHSEAARDGFVLEGYPRLEHQVDELDQVLGERRLDQVILLDVPHEEALRRARDRLVCSDRKCGKIHSRQEGLADGDPCRQCRASLAVRVDDTEESLKRRYEIYELKTLPAVELYARRGLLATVDGLGAKEVVHERVLRALSAADPGPGKPKAHR